MTGASDTGRTHACGGANKNRIFPGDDGFLIKSPRKRLDLINPAYGGVKPIEKGFIFRPNCLYLLYTILHGALGLVKGFYLPTVDKV